MRNSRLRKITAFIMIFCLIAGYMSLLPPEVFAAVPERLVMGNDYVSVSINTETGRFAVRTTGGDPGRSTDQDKSVLYEKEVPETSYTSFRIGGDEVIFGNTYRIGGQRIGYMVEAPKIEGNKAIAVWQYKDIVITQTIELMTGEAGEPIGNARVSYEAQNSSGATVNIGARILMDVKVGDNDGPVLMTTSDLYPIVRERVLEDEGLPLFWRAVDNQEDPKVVAYGILYGWADERPSKVVFGHWNNLTSAKYEYEIDQWLEYASEENIYGTADSAVAVYWDEKNLLGNSGTVYATLVGMGDLEDKEVQDGRMSVNVTAPKRIELQEGKSAPFEVLAEIDNSYIGAADRKDVYMDISYPTSCQLVEGNKTVLIPEMKKGEIITVRWKFQANPQDTVNAYSFTAMVSGSGISTEIGKAYVVMLPSFKWAPYIQYHLVTPDKMYVGEVDRKITVGGENLNYLNDNPDNWEIYVQDSEGKKTFVEKKYVEIQSNSRMTLYLPEGLAKGTFGMGINVLTQDPQLGRGFYRDNAFTINDDISLMKRGYGTLVITAKEKKVYDTSNNEYTFLDNVIHYAKGNTQVNIPSDEKELFRISGNIQQMEDKSYSIIPSSNQAVYLSKVLKLTSEGSRGEMTVTFKDIVLDYDEKGNPIGGRPQKQAIFKGNDDCRIYLDVVMKDAPASVPPKPLVWKGKFEFNVNNMEIKNPDVMGLGKDVTAFIGSYALAVVELRVVYDEDKKMYAAEFSGRMAMTELMKYVFKMFGNSSNKYLSKLFYADVAVDSFRVYEDGEVGLNMEVGVGLPQIKVGPFVSGSSVEDLLNENQTGGVEGRLKINTIDDLYSVFFGLTMPDLYKIASTNHSGGFRGEIGIFTVDTPLGPIPFPDKVEVQFKDNLGFIQIPQIPVTINQVGGGVYNLHQIRDAIDKGIYPDLGAAVWIGITDTKSPIIFGRRALSAQDCKIYVGTKYISLSGTAYLYHLPLIDGEVRLMFHPAVGAYVRGGTNIMDIIVGETKVELSYNYMTNHFYMGGYKRGYIRIPESSPFFPGKRLSDVAANINTDFVQAYANLPALNTGIGVRYTWTKPSQLPELFFYDEKDNANAGAYRYAVETEDGTKRVVVIGSNMYGIEVKQQNPLEGVYLASLGGMTSIYLASANIREFYSDGKDPLVIQAKYPKGSEIMPLTLKDPQGNDYKLVTEEGEGQNVYLSEYKPEEGEAQNYIAIMVPAEDNKEGTWTIDPNIPVEFEVYGMIRTPEITRLEAVRQDGKVDVEIEIDRESEPGYEYGVDLYIESTEDGNDTIIQLSKDGVINGREGSYAITLPEELETGSYRIIAGLNHYRTKVDGKESIGYSQKESGEIQFVNPNTPSAPANVTAVATGNGVVNVKWDAVNTPDITGYYVFAADENGNIAEGAAAVMIPAADGVTRYEADINEWEAGRDYNVVVQAVKEVYKEEPEPEEGIIEVDPDNVTIRELGNEGVYSISWSRLEGVDSYSITLEDGIDTITVPYYNNDPQNTELTAVVRELKPGTLYNAAVKGFRKKELNAQNIVVEDTGSGSRRISWDPVEDNAANAYIIGARSDENGEGEHLPLVVELQEGEYSIDAETGKCSAVLDGFVEGVDYEIFVSAKENEREVPARYLSGLSQPATLTLPVPQPPEIDIIGMPTDTDGSGAVQVLYGDQYEGNKAYFLTNVKETTFMFASDSAVKSEVTVRRPSDTAQAAPIEMDGKQWTLPAVLEDGINRILIKSYNQYGDFTEKTWMVSCKTSVPSLLMNETVISGENAIVSGITDSEATVFVNGEEAQVDSEGSFRVEVSHRNQGHFEITVRAVDQHLNENIYKETVMGSNVSAIERVAIETGISVEAGKSLPLKLFAYDSGNNRMEVPTDYVTWSVAQGGDNARIADGSLKAVKKGQCVVAASYKVTEDYSWTDMAVVDISGAEGGSTAADIAYLTNITASSGQLSPAFSPFITGYRMTIPYNLASIWLKPVTDLENATIRVDGQLVENGASSRQLTLDIGENTFDIVVEVPEMQTTAYTINVYREEYRERDSNRKDDAKEDKSGTRSIKVPSMETNGEIVATAVLNAASKAAAVELSADILNKAFDKAAVNKDGKKKVTITLPPVKGAKAYELTLPAYAISSSAQDRLFEISTEKATVTVPCDMLGNDRIPGKAALTIEQADTSDIRDEETRNRIGDRPVIQLSLKVDGKPYVWSNENAPVTVSIPYKPTAQELADPEHITIWYIDGAGNVVEIPSGRYDAAAGMVTFSTTHFSKYAVVYVTKTFSDLGSAAWAKKQIEVLASKGILEGISDKEYAPQTNITRADFLYSLVRTLGVDAKVDGNFDDISSDAYYYKELAIAKKLGITSGTGNNKFSPDASITRQDMMVLTERALRILKKLEVQGTALDLDRFADKSLVAAYAVNGVASVVKEGLIVGSGGKINPLGNTTRAEAAVFLYRIYK